MQRLTILAAVVLAAVLPLPAPAADESVIEVMHPWMRPVLPGRPGAAYLGIHNSGEADDKLVAARAEAAEAVEIHISESEDGVMKMRQLDSLDVPAYGMANLGPGGAHLMLFGLEEQLAEGDVLPITLVFESAGEIDVEVLVSSKMQQYGQEMDHGAHDMGGQTGSDAAGHQGGHDHGHQMENTAN